MKYILTQCGNGYFFCEEVLVFVFAINYLRQYNASDRNFHEMYLGCNFGLLRQNVRTKVGDFERDRARKFVSEEILGC